MSLDSLSASDEVVLIPKSMMPHHPRTHVVGVRFQKLGKLYHFDYSDYPTLAIGDHVIVETVRGQNMGFVAGFAERDESVRAYKPIMRLGTPRDLLLQQHWKSKEVEALINCREKAAQVGGFQLVKFVAAEYSFDGSALSILFTCEDTTVNTSRLRHILQKEIPAAIDFRQIGPRDVARIMGGQGACGIPRCCSTFLTEFSPISVKMAKAQGIPLNPTEITGMCGRLRCCLIYEYEQYVEARKQLPRLNKLVGTPHGEGRVVEVYPLKDGVDVEIQLEGDEDRTTRFVPRDEIIPLDEFRALKDKAGAGCTKNEGGGCDCGARRPKSASSDLKAALDLAHNQTRHRAQPSEADHDEAMAEGHEIVEFPVAKEMQPPRRRSRQRGRSDRTSQPSGQSENRQSGNPAPPSAGLRSASDGDSGAKSETNAAGNRRGNPRRRRRGRPNTQGKPPSSEGGQA